MKLLNLTLQNFRKISNIPEPTISFHSDINVLVGANNTGKTSILKAVQKLFRTQEIEEKDLNYLIEDGHLIINGAVEFEKKEIQSFLNLVKDEGNFKQEKLNLLKKNIHPYFLNRNAEFVGRKINSLDNKSQFSFFEKVKLQFSTVLEQILQEQLQNANYSNIYNTPLYLDSKGELINKEKFFPYQQLENQIKNNNKQINIRGMLFYLKEKEPEQFLDFKKRVLEIFTELSDLDVILNTDVGEFELILKENMRTNGDIQEVNYDINDVGQGMQSLVLILSTILLLKPKIVLMDEPEVHMHPSLIREFVQYIKKLSEDIQFIITTHSLVLMQEVGLEKIFVLKNDVQQKGIIIEKLDDNQRFLETINALGYDIDALTYTLKAKTFVFVEGSTDKNTLLSFAQKAGFTKQINDFNTAFIPMGGKGDRYKIVNLLEKLRQDFLKEAWLMVLDRDETNLEEIRNLQQKYFAENPERLHYLSKRQIENYLIDIPTLKQLIAEKIKDEAQKKAWQQIDLESKILELCEEQKEKIFENFLLELFIQESVVNTQTIRGILKQSVNKPINEATRDFVGEVAKMNSLRHYDLTQKTNTISEEFEQRWKTEKLEMCDGKLLLKSIRKWLETDFKVSFSNEDVIEQMETIPQEIQILLEKIVKISTN